MTGLSTRPSVWKVLAITLGYFHFVITLTQMGINQVSEMVSLGSYGVTSSLQ